MISNNGHDENGNIRGGKPGDQTGEEWEIRPWYQRGWNCVLRHPNAQVRETMAQLAEKSARNELIGYNQDDRYTYWQHLEASAYDPTKISIACDADCSSGIAAMAKATGYLLNDSKLKGISIFLDTSSIREAFLAVGFQVLTDEKYLTSDTYLLRGDLPLYEGHHICTNLTDGAYVGGETSGGGAGTGTSGTGGSGSGNTGMGGAGSGNAGMGGAGSGNSGTGSSGSGTSGTGNVLKNHIAKGQAWMNENYGSIIETSTGKRLAVDGIWGTHSRFAAVAVWKDLANRKYGASLTPSLANFGADSQKAAAGILVRKGDSGTFPYILEWILSAKGYYIGSMDAIFGSGLQTAVKAFQTKSGLSADGIVGADTWYALFQV